MQIYAQTNDTTYASTNGYISIDSGSTQYEAQPLPASNIPNNTVCPFFDDLYLDAASSPPQGIFYQFNPGQTDITYEYYLSRPGVAGEIYHFTVAYDSAQVGVFTYTYYDTGGSNDDGEFSTVGTQGSKSRFSPRLRVCGSLTTSAQLILQALRWASPTRTRIRTSRPG